MFEDTQQQALVTDGIPPQGWQLGVVGIRNPDLNLTEDEQEKELGQQDEVMLQRSGSNTTKLVAPVHQSHHENLVCIICKHVQSLVALP